LVEKDAGDRSFHTMANFRAKASRGQELYSR
jgi:hypothetical protein